MGNKRKDFRAALVDEYPGLPTLTTAKPACASTCAVDERLSVYFINRDCSAIADCRKWRVPPEAQAIFCCRRAKARRPPPC
jgi:hypothetical protein